MIKLRVPKGTKDILPPDSRRWRDFFIYLSDFFSKFSYEYIATPTIEYTDLFTSSVGTDTDIVSKEMYTFNDKGGESITLRPEGTSAVMRAYLMQDERANSVKKYWYFGPMFRYERPQKGRYREFYQFGVEVIGQDSPYLDAELIYMLYTLYNSLGINVKVLVNTIGCKLCVPNYKSVLREYYKEHYEELCDDCKHRVNTNVLRVLDCKNSRCAIVKKNAPRLTTHLCDDCTKHFNTVKKLLEKLSVPFELNYNLVRGLDYYNRTVFELVSEAFGVDKALGGGGRYDYLSNKFLNKNVPAVGFAGGVERTLSMVKIIPFAERKTIYIALIDDSVLNKFADIVKIRQSLGNVIVLDDAYKVRSLKKHLSRALKENADYMLIFGDDELKKDLFILKDLKAHKEHILALKDYEKLMELI